MVEKKLPEKDGCTMDPREALLRAATYLKWFRDRTITPDVEPPDDIGEIIITLEQLVSEESEQGRAFEDLELAELPLAARPPDELPDD